MTESRRRWVNTKHIEADIRQGYNFVYSKTGEMISRPSSDGKRAFLLEKDEIKEIEPSKSVGPAHLVIDGQAQRIEQEGVNETDERTIPGMEEQHSNRLGDGRVEIDGARVPDGDGGGGDI